MASKMTVKKKLPKEDVAERVIACGYLFRLGDLRTKLREIAGADEDEYIFATVKSGVHYSYSCGGLNGACNLSTKDDLSMRNWFRSRVGNVYTAKLLSIAYVKSLFMAGRVSVGKDVFFVFFTKATPTTSTTQIRSAIEKRTRGYEERPVTEVLEIPCIPYLHTNKNSEITTKISD